jgi:hypothetical protein
MTTHTRSDLALVERTLAYVQPVILCKSIAYVVLRSLLVMRVVVSTGLFFHKLLDRQISPMYGGMIRLDEILMMVSKVDTLAALFFTCW